MKLRRVFGLALAAGLAATAPAFATQIGPDAFGYKASDTAVQFAYEDISGTGTGQGFSDDDSASVALGFTFNFYGTDYTSVFVDSNGFIALGGDSFGDFSNEDLSLSATAPDGNDLAMIAPFWDDLDPSAAGSDDVYTQTLGPAGQRRFIVQWDVTEFSGTGNPISVQLILFEGSNMILFQYADPSFSGSSRDNGGSATVGIRNTGGVGTGQFLQWSFNSAVITAGTAIVINPEPGSIALLGLGVLGLGGLVLRRRRRKAAVQA